MTETPENVPQGVTARGVLSRACRLYLDNFLPFLSLAALGVLLYTIAALLGWTGVDFLQWFGLSLLFPFPIVFLWAGTALTVRADAALRGEELSLRASLERVAPRFWWYAQAAVLSVLAWLVEEVRVRLSNVLKCRDSFFSKPICASPSWYHGKGNLCYGRFR